MQSVTYYFTFWKNVILLQLLITYYFFALHALSKGFRPYKLILMAWISGNHKNYNIKHRCEMVKWNHYPNLTYFDFTKIQKASECPLFLPTKTDSNCSYWYTRLQRKNKRNIMVCWDPRGLDPPPACKQHKWRHL